MHVQATWSSLARIAPRPPPHHHHQVAYRAEGSHIQLVLDRHCRHFPIVRLNRSTGDEIDRDRHLVPFVHHQLYSTTIVPAGLRVLSQTWRVPCTWWWSGDQLTDAYGRARANQLHRHGQASRRYGPRDTTQRVACPFYVAVMWEAGSPATLRGPGTASLLLLINIPRRKSPQPSVASCSKLSAEHHRHSQ